MKTLVKIALMSGALAGALAVTSAVAADLSGLWIGEGKSRGLVGESPCRLNFRITHTADAYSEERQIICGDKVAPFPPFAASIEGHDLLKDGEVVGSITDTEITTKRLYKDLDVFSKAVLAEGTLDLMIGVKIPHSPDAIAIVEAVLKRSAPTAGDAPGQASRQ